MASINPPASCQYEIRIRAANIMYGFIRIEIISFTILQNTKHIMFKRSNTLAHTSLNISIVKQALRDSFSIIKLTKLDHEILISRIGKTRV